MFIRSAGQADTGRCGDVLCQGFGHLREKTGVGQDLASPAVAASTARALLAAPTVRGFLAVDTAGDVIGCAFIDLAEPVAAIGPIAVAPAKQNLGVGRRLMAAAMDRAGRAGIDRIRLTQAACNDASLSLYTRLGFEVRAPLAVLQGPAIGRRLPGCDVVPAGPEDVERCSRLCRAVHGFSRSGELHGAIREGSAMVVANHGRLGGYTTGVGFNGHTVAENDQGLTALIAAAPAFPGPGFLLPTANRAVLDWCLSAGLRIVARMNLMSTGSYTAPLGAWMPSILH